MADAGWLLKMAAEEGCQGWLMRDGYSRWLLRKAAEDGRCRFLLGWLLRKAAEDG